MNFHTPILEMQFYECSIFLMWCLGCSNLASHIYHRYLQNSTIHPLFIQCLVKAAICFMGMSVFSMTLLFSASIQWQLISIPIGLSLGWLVSYFEIKINRFTQRHLNQSIQTKRYTQYYARQGPAFSVLSLSPAVNFHSKSYLKRMHEHYSENETKQPNFSLILILLIAVFEEIIFRGYLIQLCNLLPHGIANSALVFSVIVFSISHASFGVHQMMAKAILGSCCMASVLLCHTILPAILIHGFLNWVAFFHQESRN